MAFSKVFACDIEGIIIRKNKYEIIKCLLFIAASFACISFYWIFSVFSAFVVTERRTFLPHFCCCRANKYISSTIIAFTVCAVFFVRCVNAHICFRPVAGIKSRRHWNARFSYDCISEFAFGICSFFLYPPNSCDLSVAVMISCEVRYRIVVIPTNMIYFIGVFMVLPFV